MRRALVAIALLGCRGEGNEPGRRLYTGEAPLHGRIVGHEDELPATALACANCHGPGATDGAAFGPKLDARSLGEPRSRRGGPASRYDAASFCRLLRTGVDPVDIIIQREMPRYRIDDRACADLWRYLDGSGG